MLTRLGFASACGMALALSLGTPFGVGLAATSEPAAAAPAPEVEPAAVEALKRMDAYLATLKSFEMVSDATLDVVMKSGQRVQLGSVARYAVHRPDGFQIDLATDFIKRKFYFDGKTFTVFAPELGYYATTPAPGTIRQVLDLIYDKFGISLPLDDLFRWSDPEQGRAENLKSGFVVGSSMVDGTATDHYAFREGDHDWEVWIQKGDRPLPRKLAITAWKDSARPAYIARLTWNENANIAASEFTFVPAKDAKQIRLAILGD